MSTTAGVGAGDYVAINGTAIAAVLLGVLSVIVLFDYRLFLLVPLAGVVCAVLAWATGRPQQRYAGRSRAGRAGAAALPGPRRVPGW